MICFEVTINVTSKQIIKKEVMEPNVLKLSQPLLIQRALNVDVHNHSLIHIPIPSNIQLLNLDNSHPYDIPTNFTKISYSKYAPKGIGSYESPVWVNVLRCSSLIYDPHKREQIWRFVTYMFLHADHWHLLWNTGIQLLVGEFHLCFSQ